MPKRPSHGQGLPEPKSSLGFIIKLVALQIGHHHERAMRPHGAQAQAFPILTTKGCQSPSRQVVIVGKRGRTCLIIEDPT